MVEITTSKKGDTYIVAEETVPAPLNVCYIHHQQGLGRMQEVNMITGMTEKDYSFGKNLLEKK